MHLHPSLPNARKGEEIGGRQFLFIPPLADLASSSFFFKEFLILGLAPFLVSPVLLFFVLYRMGSAVPLARRWKRVAGLLLAGGAVGSGAVFFLLPLALGAKVGYAFPDLLSVLTTVLGYTLMFVEFGLGTLFPGFVAMVLANFRGTKKTPTTEEVIQPAETTEAPPP